MKGNAMKRTGLSRGFTLIELLVVIAIIAILASILFPVLAQVRAKAWGAKCMTQMRQLHQAYTLWSQDHDGTLPHWWYYRQGYPFGTPPRGKDADYVFWTEMLEPYIKSQEVFDDPGFQWTRAGFGGEWLADQAMYTWGPWGDGTKANPYWRWAGPPMKDGQISRAAETISFTDGFTSTERTMLVPNASRHTGGMNAVFHDGHAKWIRADHFFEVAERKEGNKSFFYYRLISADRP